MKRLLFFIALLSTHVADAQNYACLQAGVKRYFINSNGYLRGIRIDSVKTYADSVVYYPFHTPRGEYNWPIGAGSTLDSNAGSWLGKKVTRFNDGTFWFDNIWGDTVVIKPLANVGDSWIFYSDTTALYYRADVIGLDTMTVLGALDSVKKILITANNASGIVIADPVDSFRLLLSKNHGFVQVFDLFTFPYHKPDSAYRTGLDYFLDETSPGFPDRSNQIFTLSSFAMPTHTQLFDWSAGDVFEKSVCDISLPGTCIYPFQYYFDSIISKTVFPDSVQYSFSGWLATQHYMFTYFHDANYPYDIFPVSGNFTVHNTFLADTSLMPEEYKQPFIFNYFPDDVGYCLPGSVYVTNPSCIIGNTWVNIHFESSGPTSTYKSGLGLVHYFIYTIGNPDEEVEDTSLKYFVRAGMPCGTYVSPGTVSVAQIKGSSGISIGPNPANNELTIKITKVSLYTIALVNLLGQTVSESQTNRTETTIGVQNIPAGVYNLCITSEGGERVNKRIVIAH